MSTDAPTESGTNAQLEQCDVWVRVDTGGFGIAGDKRPKRVRRTAKLLTAELGRRPAYQRNDATLAYPVTEEEAAELDVGTLVVPPNSKHPDGSPYAYRVVGREEEPCELGSDDVGALRRGTYTMLRLAVPTVPADATDAPSVGSPPPKPVKQPEKPLVDPGVWRSHEQVHRMRQLDQWEGAWRLMSERQKAAALEHIYLSILWDDLDQEKRDKALERIREGREFPTLFERMKAEERERREQDREERKAAAAKAERERKARERREAKEAEERAAREKADRERAERAEREAQEERERRAEEERERLQRERDELVGGPAA